MQLTLIGHDDRYAVEQLQMALFSTGREGQAESRLRRGKKWLTAETTIVTGDQKTCARRRMPAEKETVRLRRQLLQQCYYQAALPHLEAKPQWGALAGVRPTKLTTRHMLEGNSPKSAQKMMEKIYYVSPQRSRLAVDCSVSTVQAGKLLEKQDISLYVGIPFCPTRCSYCSFVSRCIGKRTELMEPYLQALEQELTHTAQLLKTAGRRIRTVYIGGGTPTTLTCQQMEQLLQKIHSAFDLSGCLEFTVEGGRPDTLTEEKLRCIRQNGADRMSINPQTMEDAVLKEQLRLKTVLYNLLEAIRVSANLLNPFLTSTSEEILRQLNTVDKDILFKEDNIYQDMKPEVLFARIDKEKKLKEIEES